MSDLGQEKIREYTTFLNTVLRPELEDARAARARVQEEMDEYRDLLQLTRHKLEKTNNSTTTSNETTTLVDLGYQTAFCHAQVSQTVPIFVDVGMGFHVELGLEEAQRFIHARLCFLQGVLELRKSREATVEEHVMSSETLLAQLAKQVPR